MRPASTRSSRSPRPSTPRYGSTTFGDSLIVARNLVASGKGTRFVQATMGGWDHHSDIYDHDAAQSLYVQCAELDAALGALLTDLTSMNILDDTLVVVVSEFGRTVGPLSGQGGRDHYLRNSSVFAGGGTPAAASSARPTPRATPSSSTAGAPPATSAPKTSPARSTPPSASTTPPSAPTTRSAAASNTCPEAQGRAHTSRSKKLGERVRSRLSYTYQNHAGGAARQSSAFRCRGALWRFSADGVRAGR